RGPRRGAVSGRARAAAALAALAAACQAPPPSGEPFVVASSYPLSESSRRVAGDRATVVSLVPPGVEPHDWEPSPQNAVEVQKARLFVYNGAGFEPWAERLARDATLRTAVVEATAGIDLLTSDGVPEPHGWLAPVLARAQVEARRAALELTEPARARAH